MAPRLAVNPVPTLRVEPWDAVMPGRVTSDGMDPVKTSPAVGWGPKLRTRNRISAAFPTDANLAESTESVVDAIALVSTIPIRSTVRALRMALWSL